MSEHSALNVRLVVRPGRVARVLGGIAVTLVAISVVLSAAKILFDSDRLEWLVDLFRLNREANIPTFFSGVLFLLAAALLVAVWRTRQGGGQRAWVLLAALFGFLSYDELFSVHEQLIDPLREAMDLSGVLYFAWIPAYAVVVLAVCGLFWGVWRRLGRRHRFWFASAAATYLLGAIGFELVGGARYSGEEGDVVYGLLYTIEESLEMAGLILFVFALLALLAEHDPPLSRERDSATGLLRAPAPSISDGRGG